MDEPRVFTSYARPYDVHVGTVSINDLSRQDQDQTIRITFSPEGELHDFVMDRDILRSEAQGLWVAVVKVGLLLEDCGLIADFDERSPAEIERIIRVLEVTPLGVRLRETFHPEQSSQSQFNWRKLQRVGGEGFFDECETLEDVTRLLQKHLGITTMSKPQHR